VPRQRQRFAHHSTRVSARLLARLVPLLLCATLVACADDTGPSFANQPTPTGGPGQTPTRPGIARPTDTPSSRTSSPVPVAQLLAAPGGASSIVLQVGDDLVAFTAPWTQPRLLWTGAGGRILAYSASPSGDLVALLVAPGKPADRVDLVLIGPDGKEVRRVKNLGRFATPTAKSPAGAYSLAWSPDGAQVLAGLASGGILSIPRSGDPRLLVGPARVAAPGQVSWSPRGDAIAFVNPVSPKKAGGLYVAPLGALPLDPVPVVPPSTDGRRTVARAAWNPDGASLLYTLASTVGDPTFGGDLFQIPATGGTPALVAGASRVGPVSAITNFAVSPDGKGVAYVVTVPDDSGNPVDSLWLQPIGSGETLRLPVGSGERVTNIWWTTDGLIWSTAPASGEPATTLYRARAGETPTIVYRGSAAPATPVASPAASPIASPVASPASSPVAASPFAAR
jgi:dipeptidyl aminopeptidase/acylaminoacyl peptidase